MMALIAIPSRFQPIRVSQKTAARCRISMTLCSGSLACMGRSVTGWSLFLRKRSHA
jgi:hypothetical protein